MSWDIAVLGFVGISAVILGYIGVELLKITVIKNDRKLLWAMLGGLFLSACLGLIYGGFGFANTLVDVQDPTGEASLIQSLTATHSFYGWFIRGLMFFVIVLVIWWGLLQLVMILKKPLRKSDVEMGSGRNDG